MLSVILYFLLYILCMLYSIYAHIHNVYMVLCVLVLRICVCVSVSSNYYKFVLILLYMFIYTYTYECMYIYMHTSIRERRGVYATYITYIIYTTIYNMYTSTTHACGRGELPLELEAEATLFEFATNIQIYNIFKIHSGRGWCGLRTTVGAGGGGRAVGVRDDSRRRVRVRD